MPGNEWDGNGSVLLRTVLLLQAHIHTKKQNQRDAAAIQVRTVSTSLVQLAAKPNANTNTIEFGGTRLPAAVRVS